MGRLRGAFGLWVTATVLANAWSPVPLHGLASGAAGAASRSCGKGQGFQSRRDLRGGSGLTSFSIPFVS